MTPILTYLTTTGILKLKSIFIKSLIASAFSTLLAGFSNPKLLAGCIQSSLQNVSVSDLFSFFPYVILQCSLSFFTGFSINVYNRMNWLFSFFGGKTTPIDPKNFENVNFEGVQNQLFLQHLVVAQNAVNLKLEEKLQLLEKKQSELETQEMLLLKHHAALKKKSDDLNLKQLDFTKKQESANQKLELEKQNLTKQQESLNQDEFLLSEDKNAYVKSKEELETVKKEVLEIKDCYENKLSEFDSTIENFTSNLIEKSSQIEKLESTLKESATVIQNVASVFKKKDESLEISIDSERLSLAVNSLKSFGEMINSQSLISLADFFSQLKPSITVHVLTDLSSNEDVDENDDSSTEISVPKH